jgi:sporulation protein YhbH
MTKINKDLSDIWKLRQRGKQDSERHKELLKKAIKEKGKHIISEYNIVTSDGNKKVKVPVKVLEPYKLKWGPTNKSGGVGQGLDGKPGQKYKIGSGNPQNGSGGEGGNEGGEILFESEITIDELVDHLIKELNLPWMEPKSNAQIEIDNEELVSREKKGIWPNVDLKKTIVQNLKRNAASGDAYVGDFKKDDLIYKNWEEQKEYESQAVVYLMMDISGSMTKERQKLAKTFYFWMIQFIKRRYKRIKIHCIAHDTKAVFVSEDEFFRTSDAGGTLCSSAFEAAYNHMSVNYDPANWNIYAVEFSDGDNWGEDNNKCVDYIRKMLPFCSMIGYGEVSESEVPSWSTRGLLSSLIKTSFSKEKKVICVNITDDEGVFPALQSFFGVKNE